MEQYYLLEGKLKLINGIHNHPLKRAHIMDTIQKTERMAIFIYGSLLWNPIKYVSETVFDCMLNGYTKEFTCEDFFYRGTTNFTGLTLGLRPDANKTVNGALLISTGDHVIPFLEEFIKRESPIGANGTVMDIYTYDFLKISMPNRANYQYALTCVINAKSTCYTKEMLTIEEQTQKIARAYGFSGTNLQYLQKLIKTYQRLKINDSFTSEIENLYEKALQCRRNLSIKDQEWLEIYDQLETAEERQKMLNTRTAISMQPVPETIACRSISC